MWNLRRSASRPRRQCQPTAVAAQVHVLETRILLSAANSAPETAVVDEASASPEDGQDKTETCEESCTAPVLNGANDFTTISTIQINNDGNSVAELIAGQVTEAEAQGIAVTSLNSSNGTWQYKRVDGGWTDVGSVSEESPLELKLDDRLRFVPGSPLPTTASVTFKVWVEDCVKDDAEIQSAQETRIYSADARTSEIDVLPPLPGQIVEVVVDKIQTIIEEHRNEHNGGEQTEDVSKSAATTETAAAATGSQQSSNGGPIPGPRGRGGFSLMLRSVLRGPLGGGPLGGNNGGTQHAPPTVIEILTPGPGPGADQGPGPGQNDPGPDQSGPLGNGPLQRSSSPFNWVLRRRGLQ